MAVSNTIASASRATDESSTARLLNVVEERLEVVDVAPVLGVGRALGRPFLDERLDDGVRLEDDLCVDRARTSAPSAPTALERVSWRACGMSIVWRNPRSPKLRSWSDVRTVRVRSPSCVFCRVSEHAKEAIASEARTHPALSGLRHRDNVGSEAVAQVGRDGLQRCDVVDLADVDLQCWRDTVGEMPLEVRAGHPTWRATGRWSSGRLPLISTTVSPDVVDILSARLICAQCSREVRCPK